MSILAAMFITLFNFCCSVCLSEGFFRAFTASKYCKREKASFYQVEQMPKKFLNYLCRATALYNLGIVVILLANTRKSLKFYCFESAQNLVFFIDSNFFWNNRDLRCVFLCFYSAIFQLTSAKFQTFAYNSRTVWSPYMKF